MLTGADPLHVAARGVLLDALEAAVAFRRSLIIVGAQAVYLRTTEARLSVAAFTCSAICSAVLRARALPWLCAPSGSPGKHPGRSPPS